MSLKINTNKTELLFKKQSLLYAIKIIEEMEIDPILCPKLFLVPFLYPLQYTSDRDVYCLQKVVSEVNFAT